MKQKIQKNIGLEKKGLKHCGGERYTGRSSECRRLGSGSAAEGSNGRYFVGFFTFLGIFFWLGEDALSESLDLPFTPPSFSKAVNFLSWVSMEQNDPGVIYFFGGEYVDGTTEKSNICLYHLHYQGSKAAYTSAGTFLKTPPAQHTQRKKIGTETDNNQKLLKFSKAGFFTISRETQNILGLDREQLIGSNSPPDPDYDKFFSFTKAPDNDFDIPKRSDIVRNTGDTQIEVDLLAPGPPENRDYLYTDLVSSTRIQMFLRLNRNNQNAGMVIEDTSPTPTVTLYRKNDQNQKFVHCHFIQPGKCLGLFLDTKDNLLIAEVMEKANPPTPGQSLVSSNEGTIRTALTSETHEYTGKIEYIRSIIVHSNYPSASFTTYVMACIKKGDFHFLVYILYFSNPSTPGQHVVLKAVPLNDRSCFLLRNVETSATRFYMAFHQKSTNENKIAVIQANFNSINSFNELKLIREVSDPNLAKPETMELYRDGIAKLFVSFARDPNKADFEPRIYFKYAFTTSVPNHSCSLTNCLFCLPGNKCGGCETGFYVDSSLTCSACSTQFSGCQKCHSGACFQCDGGTGWSLVDTEGKKYSTFGCKQAGCPAQQTMFKGACTACPSSCEECYERANTDTEPSCSKCSSGMGVDPGTRQCVACASNEYVDPKTSQCKPCSASCLTCSGNADTCTSCNPTGSLKYLDSSTCVQLCPSGFVQNPSNNICEACSSPCSACDKQPANCIDCAAGYTKILKQNSIKCLLFNCQQNEYIDKDSESCKPCPEGCLTCTGSQSCQTCLEGYKLSTSTNLCQNECPDGTILRTNDKGIQQCLECPQDSAWIPPNNCEACPEACSRCLGVTKDCFENIEFMFYEAPKNEPGYDIALWGNIYKVVNGVREPFDISILKKSKNLEEFYGLKIEIPGQDGTPAESVMYKDLESNLEWSPVHQKIVLKAKIPEDYKTPKTYNIQTQPASKRLTAEQSSTTWQFILPNTNPVTKEYRVTQKTDENTLKNTQSAGRAVSRVTESSSYVLNYGSLISSLINVDQSGSMLRMAQTTKLMSRMRLMGVNFGVYLQEFMDHAALSFGKPSEFTNDEFERRSPQRYAKFSEKAISLSLLEPRFRMPIFLYIGFSSLKWVLWGVLCLMERFEKLNKAFLKVFSMVKKIQFSLFNMAVLDVAFFGLRSLAHTKGGEMKWDYFVAIICMVFGVLDFFEVIQSLMDFGKEMKTVTKTKHQKDHMRRGLEKFKKGHSNSLEFQLVMSSMIGQGGNVMNRLKKKELKASKKTYSDEEMTEILKIYPKFTQDYTKKINLKKTAKLHTRNNPAIKQAVSELTPTTTTASHLPPLFENLAFLTKTIIYQVLLVSLPRSPQLQIILLFCTELSYLALLITNYRRFKHLKSVVLFVAKLPLSVFLLLILILCAKFSIWESIERRKGTRRASPPSSGLQIVGVALILGSVVVEYILLIYKLYLSLRDFLRKKKKGEGSKSEKRGKVRPASARLGGIEEIPAEGINHRTNKLSKAHSVEGGDSKPLELPKDDKIFYYWERKDANQEQIQEESIPITLNKKPLGERGIFSARRQISRKNHQKNFPSTKQRKNRGLGIKRLPSHNQVPRRTTRKLSLEECLKMTSNASWVHQDDLSLPRASPSQYQGEIGASNLQPGQNQKKETEEYTIDF